jgi:uncharacterized protein YegP (UPF0339 family)
MFASKSAILIPDVVAHTQRSGDFDYALPLKSGAYELRLYFAPRLSEPDALSKDQTHQFDVFLNGSRIMASTEVYATHNSGRNWTIRVFRGVRASSDGKLHLAFRSRVDRAYLSGIELTPDFGGPIRFVSRNSPVLDKEGNSWSLDRYAEGGTLVSRTEPFPPELDPNVYSGERYGDFRYAIPVAIGRYRVKLHFAETFFDAAQGNGGVGRRRFDVLVNGRTTLADFDIAREAGGSFRAVVKAIPDVQPEADGRIHLQFVSRVNHACVNAVELIKE